MSQYRECYRANRQHTLSAFRANNSTLRGYVDIEAAGIDLRLFVQWTEDGKYFIYESKPFMEIDDGVRRWDRLRSDAKSKAGRLIIPTTKKQPDSPPLQTAGLDTIKAAEEDMAESLMREFGGQSPSGT
jgi:hypothetical protein